MVNKNSPLFPIELGEFAIMDKGTVVCLGRCYTSEECPLKIQDIFHEQNIDQRIESEVTLDTADVYKELRVQGYDYGVKFRGIKKFVTKDYRKLYGQIEWNGNWITFLDSLFQTMALTIPFRKLMVPVMISSLRCDPKVFFGAVQECKVTDNKLAEELSEKEEMLMAKTEEHDHRLDIFCESNNQELLEHFIDESFHKYKSMMSFYSDVESRIFVTNGLEIEDLLAVPISRRNVSTNDLKLESYEFVANEEIVERCDQKYLEEYLHVTYFK